MCDWRADRARAELVEGSPVDIAWRVALGWIGSSISGPDKRLKTAWHRNRPKTCRDVSTIGLTLPETRANNFDDCAQHIFFYFLK